MQEKVGLAGAGWDHLGGGPCASPVNLVGRGAGSILRGPAVFAGVIRLAERCLPSHPAITSRLNSQGESLQEGESFVVPLLMDGYVFTLAFPTSWLLDGYLSDEFIYAGTPESWGQRRSIYYSGLAQGRRNNREEMGSGCTSKLSLPFPSRSPRFHLAGGKGQAQASGLACQRLVSLTSCHTGHLGFLPVCPAKGDFFHGEKSPAAKPFAGSSDPAQTRRFTEGDHGLYILPRGSGRHQQLGGHIGRRT